jgi:hypothetical protein
MSGETSTQPGLFMPDQDQLQEPTNPRNVRSRSPGWQPSWQKRGCAPRLLQVQPFARRTGASTSRAHACGRAGPNADGAMPDGSGEPGLTRPLDSST